jgi:hypothetical protein
VGRGQKLINSAFCGHADSGQPTVTPAAGCQPDSVRPEELRGGGMALDEASPEAPGRFTHGVDRADEVSKAGSIGPADKAGIVLRIHRHPFEARRQVLRNAPTLAVHDGSTGPVDQFEIIADFVRNSALRIVGLRSENGISLPMAFRRCSGSASASSLSPLARRGLWGQVLFSAFSN